MTPSDKVENEPTIMRTKHGKTQVTHIVTSLNSLENFNDKIQRLWRQDDNQEKSRKPKKEKRKQYAQTDYKQHRQIAPGFAGEQGLARRLSYGQEPFLFQDFTNLYNPDPETFGQNQQLPPLVNIMPVEQALQAG